MRALVLLMFVSACAGPDEPATPTYQDDVRPILLANCARCHGELPAGVPDAGMKDPPHGFRLDVWEGTGVCPPTPDAAPGGPPGCIRGVRDMAERITVRAADEGTMPPTAPLSAWQRDVIRRWARAGWPG